MIITVVCDVLGEENNGTTIAAMNLIRFLKSQGHIVRILCGDQEKKGQENVFVVPNYNLGKVLNAYVKKVGVTLAKPVENIIKKALKGADAVHIMVPLPLGMASVKIAKQMNLPITAGFHMQAENFTSHIKLNKLQPLNKFVYKFIYKHVYKYVDGIHYPTQFIRDVFESNIKKQTPGYVISNGVHNYVQKRDTEKPEEFKDKIVILSTGRYAREKSQDILIKAVNLSKYKDKIQLILGGQGAKEKEYKRLSKKLPIKPIFKFFSRTDIIDVLNYCDIYAHPAEIELEGISCIEAIACGKLTIVSDSKLSATKEFAIDEKCICKKRNAKSLARVIDYWIEHEEERKEYEQKYLESAKVFNQDECMKNMEQMILEVANEKKERKTA
ncbi:MAG: glycosyltransferase [Clostridia bacterium]|nr:glycosyltransferase [Clostridia bacterium]